MVGQSKRDYLAKIKDRYRHASREGKTHILDEFCAVCEHHRKHAIRLLNKDGRARRKKPGRPSGYGAEEIRIVEHIWLHAGRPCGARMAVMVRLWLPFYEKHHGDLEASQREKLLQLKPRTLDRLLVATRKKHGRRGLSGTVHGDYLARNIPVRISHHDVEQPGFVQADTVAHCGGSLDGDFVWSLTFTDVFSGWTENRAVWNKGQHGVFQMLQDIEEHLPFAIRNFHTDNGGEFINHHLYNYYQQRPKPVQMTRGRAGRKNDNPHVEQKNWTHVRQLLGYQRIADPGLLQNINLLYAAANLLNNFFGACRRLTFKERRGARYYKRFDAPATPCERLLASPQLNELQKTWLMTTRHALDPYQLRKTVDALQHAILSKLR